AQLIGVIGRNSPLKAQAVSALTRCDWPLAISFLSALTPPDMVFVPAGELLMGSDEAPDEQPLHRVWLPSFYLDRAPVTNAQFAAFWEEVSYEEPSAAWEEFEDARQYIRLTDMRRAPLYWFDKDWNHPQRPVVGVCWPEAVVFARWAGKRLPSEVEWEKAARGIDGRRYPWGNAFDPSLCNTVLAEYPLKSTSSAGSYSPRGDSPYGAQDMSGNIWEWVASLYQPYPYESEDGREDLLAPGARVLRGGAFGSYFEDHYRSAHRHHNIPQFAYINTGFRCAATVPPHMRT
ncbi:MAG: formylglycine-generating enzyme family protein, partial [Chloroflexi bacterium]|nr:formylglycine-generating enzyme family protein [Chloroflexota bacterium]